LYSLFHAKHAEENKTRKDEIMTENEFSYKIIGVAIHLHKSLGPGLLESAYEHALANDLRELGFEVKQQIPMPFIYKDVNLEVGFRIDLIVNGKVIIEVKSIESLSPVHFAQSLTYLRLSGLKLALLINFNSKIKSQIFIG
jgi:GxxExxY protein